MSDNPRIFLRKILFDGERMVCPERIPCQGRSQQGDPVVRLGTVCPLPFVQGPTKRKGRDQGSAAIQFVCQRCGLKDNADQNASRVLAQRGIRLLLEGKIQKKEVRRCGIGKEKQLGQELSEVKASGEENKTRGQKRLRASSAKEELPLARTAPAPKRFAL